MYTHTVPLFTNGSTKSLMVVVTTFRAPQSVTNIRLWRREGGREGGRKRAEKVVKNHKHNISTYQ